MGYDRPKGRELKILKQFKKLDNLSFASYSVTSPSVSCTYGHALEGVRTNGREHLTSLSSYRYEWLQEMKETKEWLKDWNKYCKKIEDVHQQFETEIQKYFLICGVCNGKGGKKHRKSRGVGYIINIWDDCEKCNGRGLIKNEK